MANGDNPLKTFYQELSSSGVVSNLPGSFEKFDSTLSDPDKRRAFYNELNSSGVVGNLPDYDTFNNRLFEVGGGEDEVETPSIETPPEKPVTGGSDNPIVNFGRTFWNVATKQIPSALKGGLAATLNTGLATSPGAPQPFVNEQVRERAQEVREGIPEERVRLAIEGMDLQEDFASSQEGLVTQVSQIEDPIDAVNYVTNSVAQAAAQIPASVLTFGGTSIGQEIGMIYLDQVRKISEEKDVDPEDVIRRGMDDKASAIAYGTFAGALDYLGAKGVADATPFKQFKSSVSRRGLGMLKAAGKEFSTEGSQSIIEQFGSSRGAGDSIFKALTGIDLKQAGEEALAGAIGGGGLSAFTVIADDIKQKKSRLQDPGLSKEERVEAENDVGQTQIDAFGNIARNQVDSPFANQAEDATAELESSSREKSVPKTITLAPIDDTKQGPYKRPGKVKRTIEEYFFSRGNMPQPVFERNLKRQNLVDAELERARQLAFDLDKAIKNEFEVGRVANLARGEGFQKTQATQEQLSTINDVLRGREDPSAVPESIREPVSNMRDHVDRLSRKLIDSGVVEGELEAVIDQNIGVYLNRSYRVHDDPKWSEKVPDDIKNRAKAFVRDQYKEMGQDLTDQQVNNIIGDILYNDDAPIGILSGSKVGSKDYSVLRKRKDIAPEIRALMGEYTDPLLNYSRSVEKMANLIESHRFLTDVRDQGMGKFFFEEGDTNRPEGFNAKIAADGSEVMAPLNGLMTTPEIKGAFEAQFDAAQNPTWLEWYLKANSFVKLGKTAASITTQIRNVIGGMAFMINAGHNPLTASYKTAISTIKNTFRPTNQDARDRIVRYKELGILAAGARSGEIEQYIRDTNITGAQDSGQLFQALEKGQNWWQKAKKGGQKVVSGLSNIYQSGDAFLRVLMFESEKAQYREALPDATEAEIEEVAADIVRNTYQNYDVLSKSVKAVQKIPLFGTFASFPAEVIRTSVNTSRQWFNEINSDNANIKRIGYKRMAGQMAAIGIVSTGIQETTKYFLGVGDEEDRDLRRFLPPWSKLSSIAYLEKKPGMVRYTDLSYTDPYEYLRDPIMHLALNGEKGFKEKLIKSFGEFIKPFAGEEILVQKVREAVSNKKSGGGRIYNPRDPEWFMDAMAHVWEAFEPGVVSQGKRVIQAYRDVTDRYGNKRNIEDEVMGLFGFRASEVDIGQSLYFKGRGFYRSYLDDRSLYNEVRFRHGNVTQEELDKAYERANMQYKKDWEELRKDVEAAYRLGLDREDINKKLNEAGVPKKIIRTINQNRFQKFDRR